MRQKSISELFETEKCVNICAPMVRYSKLPFRLLVRQYGCHVACTPMIVADAFTQSERARHIEFTTNKGKMGIDFYDRPLVVQFAANNAEDFAAATELVYNHSDGVNLNCGCPQQWAMSKNLGAFLLTNPQLVSDMIRQTRNRIPSTSDNFSISAKIRIDSNIGKSVDFCRQIQNAGVDWIAIHSRTVKQRCEPINIDSLRIIRESLDIPVVANGDIWTQEDARVIQKETGVSGVMCARGLLQNPEMFSQTDQGTTSIECIKKWLDIATETGICLNLMQHHLLYM
uniref:tRNA-dihydrouridine synthase n=1 Tax=Strigamia maritima TaxID=126957 RepID=T1IMX1_STRMM